MWFKILLVPKNMVIITKTWSLVPHDRWCKKINDEKCGRYNFGINDHIMFGR